MRRTKLNIEKSDWSALAGMAAIALLLAGGFPTPSMGQQRGQKTFSSAEEATNALAKAAQSNDEKAMLEILGPDGRQVVSSGDAIEDEQNHANFAKKYQQMHRLVRELDGTTVLYIGAENWPAPIPLMNKGNVWFFDTKAGIKEILYRRIGLNEMSAIRVCQEMVAAEKEYYLAQHNVYAQQIFSNEGQQNGLYWKVADGEAQSPIGPLVADAVAEGYARDRSGAPTPYRGYYYNILRGQGKNAPGGAKSYLVNGKMTEGFAFVAYPAEYRSSGVMTFLIGQDGVVYQKDLGKNSEKIAIAMKEYNPDSSWQKVDVPMEETASAEQKTSN